MTVLQESIQLILKNKNLQMFLIEFVTQGT